MQVQPLEQFFGFLLELSSFGKIYSLVSEINIILIGTDEEAGKQKIQSV